MSWASSKRSFSESSRRLFFTRYTAYETDFYCFYWDWFDKKECFASFFLGKTRSWEKMKVLNNLKKYKKNVNCSSIKRYLVSLFSKNSSPFWFELHTLWGEVFFKKVRFFKNTSDPQKKNLIQAFSNFFSQSAKRASILC